MKQVSKHCSCKEVEDPGSACGILKPLQNTTTKHKKRPKPPKLHETHILKKRWSERRHTEGAGRLATHHLCELRRCQEAQGERVTGSVWRQLHSMWRRLEGAKGTSEDE